MMFLYCDIYLGEGILDIPDPAEEEERDIFFRSRSSRLCTCHEIQGFPKIRFTFLGVLTIRTIVY